MNKIKAIAFDLGGVFLMENDYPLSSVEEILERKFGKINIETDYYKRAKEATNLEEDELKEMVANIIDNIYDLRDPYIFESLPKIKLAIASNHLSEINNRIDNIGIRDRFDCILISADMGIEKPNKEFYEKLIEELHERPEDILFIDDSMENIEGAKTVGLSVLHYDRSQNLTDVVLDRLK